MAAADLGLDVVEIRRRNLITEGEMPYPLTGWCPHKGPSYTDTGDYLQTFERASQRSAGREIGSCRAS